MSSLRPDFAASPEKLPALVVGHGSPMNAIEDNEFSRAWAEVGRSLPRPEAILCVSAHWETSGTQVTAMETPRTIHDFSGFPRELNEYRYPAPGSPALAGLVRETLAGSAPVALDQTWGLDHGTWSVLTRMYPQADLPIVQLSLDQTRPPADHYRIGQALRPLRRRGVLIVGSGNVVHNLGLARFDLEGRAYDWAAEFDETLRRLIAAGDHRAVVEYERLGRAASLAIPTNEHYLPLLYVLGLQEEGEGVEFFAEGMTFGSLSMRSIRVG